MSRRAARRVCPALATHQTVTLAHSYPLVGSFPLSGVRWRGELQTMGEATASPGYRAIHADRCGGMPEAALEIERDLLRREVGRETPRRSRRGRESSRRACTSPGRPVAEDRLFSGNNDS